MRINISEIQLRQKSSAHLSCNIPRSDALHSILTPLPFCLCPSDKIFLVSVERSPCLWTRQGFVGKRV